MDINGLPSQLSQNRFDPDLNSRSSLPDSAGLYLVCLKVAATLPKLFDSVTFCEFNGSKVLYVGIAGTEKSKRKSLRERDYGDHFERNNAGKSTLRKSLGVIFGYKLIPRDRDPSTGKTKFADKDEAMLSSWMKQSLFLYYAKHPTPWIHEDELIERLNPPLNLGRNNNSVNLEFRKKVSQLRNPK